MENGLYLKKWIHAFTNMVEKSVLYLQYEVQLLDNRYLFDKFSTLRSILKVLLL